jgi:methylmalonyl-CoA/ethylmalonyl-CoA epimerase
MGNQSYQDLRPPGQVKLHHVGFVLPSIEEAAPSIATSLGATWNGIIILDPLQNVRVSFLQGSDNNDALIELVEPHGPTSPVAQFLGKGGGLHHLCYEVENLESHLEFCRQVKTFVLRPPVPAIAFNGRRIAWALTAKKILLEFLER